MRATTVHPQVPPVGRTRKRVGVRASASALLLALGLLVVAACGEPTTPLVPPSTASPGGTFAPASVVGSVGSIHLFNATTGWAATVDQVLRTTDGGHHWREVTPPTPAGPSLPHVDAFPLSADEAWVVHYLVDHGPGASQSAVSHTTDGGQTWHSITLPIFAVAQITFADPAHGWMLANLDTAESEQAADIFRTTDGGQTWTKVSSTADRVGALPITGRKSGLTFHDATTGWAAGAGIVSTARSGTPWFFRTQDGGASWQLAPIALPAPLSHYPGYYVAGVLPPTFFSVQDGVLPIIVGSQSAGGAVQSLVYVTHDGGASWHPTTPVDTTSEAASWLDAIDASEWWIAPEHDANGPLFHTTDAGQHWTSWTPGSPFTNVYALSFGSSMLGWAIGDPGLLQTTDGGHTWTILAAAPPVR